MDVRLLIDAFALPLPLAFGSFFLTQVFVDRLFAVLALLSRRFDKLAAIWALDHVARWRRLWHELLRLNGSQLLRLDHWHNLLLRRRVFPHGRRRERDDGCGWC